MQNAVIYMGFKKNIKRKNVYKIDLKNCLYMYHTLLPVALV